MKERNVKFCCQRNVSESHPGSQIEIEVLYVINKKKSCPKDKLRGVYNQSEIMTCGTGKTKVSLRH